MHNQRTRISGRSKSWMNDIDAPVICRMRSGATGLHLARKRRLAYVVWHRLSVATDLPSRTKTAACLHHVRRGIRARRSATRVEFSWLATLGLGAIMWAYIVDTKSRAIAFLFRIR